VFNDMCIDAWWQSGGEQTQIEIRRHDLSDAVAFLGIASVPRAVMGYSINSVMLRNEDKDSYIEIVDDDKTVNIIGAEKVNVAAVDDINVNSDSNINVDAQANIIINAQGNISVNAQGNIDVASSSTITLSSPSLIIEADIEHTGNMNTSGNHVDSVGPHYSYQAGD